MHRWGLLILVGAMLLALWGLIFGIATFQKTRLVDDRQRELAQLNSAVAQQTAGLFKSLDTSLRTLELWLQSNPGIDPRTDTRFVALTNELRRAAGGLIELRMVSTDGKLFYIPTLNGKPLADVRDRAYYTAHLDGGEQRLVIGDPVFGRFTRNWVLPISWRLETPVSGIAIVFAAIQLDRLVTMHDRMRMKPSGSISLLRQDGILLSRTPHDPALVGKDMSGTPGYRSEFSVRPRGSFITDGAVTDGIARVVSYERLEEYPITVVMTEGLEDMLAIYYARRSTAMGIALVFTLIVLAFTIVLHRSLHALQAAQGELRHLATVDSLTGVLSRRAFLDAVQREFNRSSRYGRPAAVLALDLDHFKQVNDTHGHAIGDRVLRECADAWKSVLRDQDILGRTGGEEFFAVLPETPPASARQVAERLRQAVADLRFPGVDGEFSVTVSIGQSGIAPADERLEQAMERADRALYLAKERGRNRVELLDEPRLAVIGRARSD